MTEPLSADQVLSVLAECFDVGVSEFKRRRHNSALRAVAARYLTRFAGQSQRDVADLLNVGSGAAVCNQLARLPAKLTSDRHLRKRFQQAEDKLRTLAKERQKENATKR